MDAVVDAVCERSADILDSINFCIAFIHGHNGVSHISQSILLELQQPTKECADSEVRSFWGSISSHLMERVKIGDQFAVSVNHYQINKQYCDQDCYLADGLSEEMGHARATCVCGEGPDTEVNSSSPQFFDACADDDKIDDSEQQQDEVLAMCSQSSDILELVQMMSDCNYFMDNGIAPVDYPAIADQPISSVDASASYDHPINPVDYPATLESVIINSQCYALKLDASYSPKELQALGHVASDFVQPGEIDQIQEPKHYQSFTTYCPVNPILMLSNSVLYLMNIAFILNPAVPPSLQSCLFDRFRLLVACTALLLGKLNKYILFFYFVSRCRAGQYIVSTLAGSGVFWADGTGTSVNFNYPCGVAVDTFGNVFVGDTSNHRIRKVTSQGIVSELAGSGIAGFSDGLGTTARFNNPHGMAMDSFGNVFVADQITHHVRKVTSSGVVTSFAGSVMGWADGTGSSAQLYNPQGVTVDAFGNVFVGDTYHHRIRMVTSLGVVSTLVGSGVADWADEMGTSVKFSYPVGVAVDSNGNVFVCDSYNHRIRMVTSLGFVSTLAGSGVAGWADGTGTFAKFNYPVGVAVDAFGNVFIGDKNNNRIRIATSLGVVSTLAGSSTYGWADGSGSAAKFHEPFGVVVDKIGNVIVADAHNSRIRMVSSLGDVSTLAGSAGWGWDGVGSSAFFSGPQSVAVDTFGNVFVADCFNHRIRMVTSLGVVSTVAGSSSYGWADGIRTSAMFRNPQGVVSAFGNVYVGDLYNNRIRVVTSLGVVSTLAGSAYGWADGKGSSAMFSYIYYLAVDTFCNVFAADSANNRIRMVTSMGDVSTVAGSGVSGWADGIGTSAMFNAPRSVAVDTFGNLFVGDTNNHRIRMVTSLGVVSTLAGSGVAGWADRTGTSAAMFYSPVGVAVDSNANVFVCDASNNRIRMVTSLGFVSTLVGSAYGWADGTGTSAMFSSPQGVAVDAFGNVFIGDTANNRIRKVTWVDNPTGQPSRQPLAQPTSQPSLQPTRQPVVRPTSQPSLQPLLQPTSQPTSSPLSPLQLSGVNWQVSTLVGWGPWIDGTGTAATFNNPSGIACCDSSGSFYIADFMNNRIRVLTSWGSVITLAGSGRSACIDGVGSLASFYGPAGIAVDSTGYVYVLEYSDSRLRKISLVTGSVSTFGWLGAGYGYSDGTGTQATFTNWRTSGLAIDSNRDLC